ncbi:MAG: hypothetical protein ABJO27_23275 [Pseudoruegeria sp.]
MTTIIFTELSFHPVLQHAWLRSDDLPNALEKLNSFEMLHHIRPICLEMFEFIHEIASFLKPYPVSCDRHHRTTLLERRNSNLQTFAVASWILQPLSKRRDAFSGGISRVHVIPVRNSALQRIEQLEVVVPRHLSRHFLQSLPRLPLHLLERVLSERFISTAT